MIILVDMEEYKKNIMQILNKDTIEEAIEEYNNLSDDDRLVLDFIALTTIGTP